MNTNNESERKSDIFPWDIFNSDIIFIERKILKYLNDILSFFLFNFNRCPVFFLIYVVQSNLSMADT